MELDFFNEIGKYEITQTSGIDQDPNSYISYFSRYY
jgi:hypothetical protein